MRQGVPHPSSSLAVVVQELVEAEAAGVLFAANTVSGQRGQLVLDAAWGQGEAPVSGRANPDPWVVEAASGKVLEGRIARKEIRTALRDGETFLVPVPVELQVRPVLDESRAASLVALGRLVAGHWGGPQDIPLPWMLETRVTPEAGVALQS